MKSDFLSIKWKDLLKGLIVAAITAGLFVLGQSIEGGELPTKASLILAGKAAAVAGIGYLIKNFFSNGVPAAVKTVEKAGGTVIENDNNGFNRV